MSIVNNPIQIKNVENFRKKKNVDFFWKKYKNGRHLLALTCYKIGRGISSVPRKHMNFQEGMKNDFRKYI